MARRSAASGGGSGGSGASCGTVNLAVNPWVGYEADAAVYAYVAKTKLNCNVVQKDLKEQVSWAGFGTGEVDLILENWGHPDLTKQYITDQKTAVDLGQTGNKGIIGWYVPPWLAQAHPDITDWNNLNKYADQFKTSESGDKGQLLDGDPSYVTNDNALVNNLNLNFKVVQGGSETALIQSFRQAERPEAVLPGLLLRAAVVLPGDEARQGEPAAVQGGLRRRPGEGRVRLPAVRPQQDREREVRELGQPGGRAGQEVPVDQRRPERGRAVHRRRQDVRRRRREEVGGRQPGQGRRPGCPRACS